VVVGIAAASRVVVEGVEVAAGQRRTDGQAKVGADLGGHRRVVPGDDLDGDAECGEAGQRGGRVGFGRVEEDQQPGQS